MKTMRLLFLGVMGLLAISKSNAQTANANVTSYGLNAGTSTVASGSSYYGYQAGNISSTNTANLRNTFIGDQSGKSVVNTTNNTFIGYSTGGQSIGSSNTALGSGAFSSSPGTLNNNCIFWL